MIRKGIKIFAMILIMIFLFGIVIWDIMAREEKANALGDFCKKKGYDTYEQSLFRGEKDICIKIENDTLFEAEVVECGFGKWCFVKEVKR